MRTFPKKPFFSGSESAASDIARRLPFCIQGFELSFPHLFLEEIGRQLLFMDPMPFCENVIVTFPQRG